VVFVVYVMGDSLYVHDHAEPRFDRYGSFQVQDLVDKGDGRKAQANYLVETYQLATNIRVLEFLIPVLKTALLVTDETRRETLVRRRSWIVRNSH
jgi:hypothetical protein